MTAAAFGFRLAGVASIWRFLRSQARADAGAASAAG
jgi:hypothetical protein